jgi:transcriptional regulator
MYLPRQFICTDHDALLAFIAAHPFATLITGDAGGTQAGHVPLLATERADGLVLRGHLAAANPQARHGGPALAVFHGPHAYISASWYDADDTVPTWNYQVVHARGELVCSHDEATKNALLDDLARAIEGVRAQRWQERLGPAMRARLLPQIVAFELRVSGIDGKWKLGQQHAPERRLRAAAALRAEGGDMRLALAAAMEGTVDDGRGRS